MSSGSRVPSMFGLALLLTLSACGGAGDPTPLTLEGLATSWSGGRSDPTCQPRGPRGEYLGVLPGIRHCQWPTVTRDSEFGTVTAIRDSLRGLSNITWERVLADTMRVAALIDSLERRFTRAGLSSHRCSTGGMRWQSDELIVQSVPAIARPAGGQLVMIFATTMPAAIPRLLCPDAPPLPVRGPVAGT